MDFFDNDTHLTFQAPSEVPGGATRNKESLWRILIKNETKWDSSLEHNLSMVHSLIIRLCTEKMRPRVEALPTQHNENTSKGTARLKGFIKLLCYH